MLNDYKPMDILIACALRFDGYKCMKDSGMEPKAAAEAFFRTGRWDLTDSEKLTTFYCLQRALGKWDLVYESFDGCWWRAFRTLFFEVAHLPIPEQYQMPGYYDAWQKQYVPHLEECIERVRLEHESIKYTA